MLPKEVYDVAIIGGGPGGATCAGMLRKYAPELKVCVLEAAKFPREHIGESQLPPVTRVLNELGCWDKVEAEGYPVKIGAVYRWGTTDDTWNFDFLAGAPYDNLPRPGKLEGQRWETTFHVERATFDKIVLDHVKEMGATVYEETRVTKILKADDSVAGLVAKGPDGEKEIEAKYYVDASGHVGALRKAMGVAVDEPTSLKNVAFWNYWEKEEWADMEHIGWGGVQVRVMCIGSGWIWFIPLSPTRTSVGFVTHANHYKASGMRPEEMYNHALQSEPRIRELLEGAKVTGTFSSTKDWSFLAERMAGENWMLVGEAGGFADPILAGGMTLTMTGAREAAYILISILRGEQKPQWLKDYYDESQKRRIGQHIRFADFWYSANTHFTELKEYTTKIAADAGLDLDPEAGFRWLAAGGFAGDDLSSPIVGVYRLGAAKILLSVLTGKKESWKINEYNVFKLDTKGAKLVDQPYFFEGTITRAQCYTRDKKILPLVGIYRLVVEVLLRESDAARAMTAIQGFIQQNMREDPEAAMRGAIDAIEAMIAEGWIMPSVNPDRPLLGIDFERTVEQVHR